MPARTSCVLWLIASHLGGTHTAVKRGTQVLMEGLCKKRTTGSTASLVVPGSGQTPAAYLAIKAPMDTDESANVQCPCQLDKHAGHT